jgi:hypothetical protein
LIPVSKITPSTRRSDSGTGARRIGEDVEHPAQQRLSHRHVDGAAGIAHPKPDAQLGRGVHHESTGDGPTRQAGDLDDDLGIGERDEPVRDGRQRPREPDVGDAAPQSHDMADARVAFRHLRLSRTLLYSISRVLNRATSPCA